MDWASWNDTYYFINDSNEEYIRTNLRLEIFTNLRVNLMLFINSSGNIVYGRSFDLENQAEVPVPRYFEEKLSPDDYLLQHFDTTESSKTGMIFIPEGPMLVASQPILQNDRTGPIRGTMITGRFLNSEEIKRLSGITHLPLSIQRYDDKQMPSDFQAVLPFFSKVLNLDIFFFSTFVSFIHILLHHPKTLKKRPKIDSGCIFLTKASFGVSPHSSSKEPCILSLYQFLNSFAELNLFLCRRYS